MEIWLSKKAHPPLASRLWYSMVWGSVSALALTAVADMLFAGPLIAVFWGVMVLNTALTLAIKRLTKPIWLLISGLSVLVLISAYVAVHGNAAYTISSLQLNIPMAGYVIWSLYRARTLINRVRANRADAKNDGKDSNAQVAKLIV